MNNKRIALFGLYLWLIPFVASIPFVGSDGQPRVDLFLFKSLMIVIGVTTGMLLLRRLLAGADRLHAKLGNHAAVIWTLMQWGLDLAVLLPISGMSFGDYVNSIGLRYLGIAAICHLGGKIAEDAVRANPYG